MTAIDEATRKRLCEVASLVAHDYPGIETCNPWQQFWAIEQSHIGSELAFSDYRNVVEALREKCGMSPEELNSMFERLAIATLISELDTELTNRKTNAN